MRKRSNHFVCDKQISNLFLFDSIKPSIKRLKWDESYMGCYM